jgi:hypothetical protein
MTSAGGPLRLDALCDAGRDGVAARQAGLPSGVRQVHRAVLRTFLETRAAPHAADLPRPAGIGRNEALALLDRLDLVHLDRAGRVVVAYPFSGRRTAHSVRLDDGPPLHAMCAIDAVGIPLMARRDAVIVSADPIDRHPILVEQRDTTWQWAPTDTVVLLAQSSGCGPAADRLCPAITFHTTRRRAEEQLRRHPDLTGLVINQDHALDIVRQSFGPLLTPNAANGHPG